LMYVQASSDLLQSIFVVLFGNKTILYLSEVNHNYAANFRFEFSLTENDLPLLPNRPAATGREQEGVGNPSKFDSKVRV
jgi:hypothetical protein